MQCGVFVALMVHAAVIQRPEHNWLASCPRCCKARKDVIPRVVCGAFGKRFRIRLGSLGGNVLVANDGLHDPSAEEKEWPLAYECKRAEREPLGKLSPQPAGGFRAMHSPKAKGPHTRRVSACALGGLQRIRSDVYQYFHRLGA